ncbi:hypothetical protein AGDE_16468 [Angomonas deanei]|nr:hypothetical protein AGDE_16468 [Angomonas deanei]|eukprot:EPY17029.1 hypothetical protein AGDE_16468 [Angomonas deanei]
MPHVAQAVWFVVKLYPSAHCAHTSAVSQREQPSKVQRTQDFRLEESERPLSHSLQVPSALCEAHPGIVVTQDFLLLDTEVPGLHV